MLDIIPNGRANEQEVKALEQTLGFSLPEDYYSFLLEHNGGEVKDYQSFFVRGLAQEVLMHVFFGVNQPIRSQNVQFWANEFQEDLQEDAFIFGREPGGALLTYITTGEDKGVYLWDHAHFFPQSSEEDGNTYFVADSFADFCAQLKPFVESE
ncbi:SMI1/KNR4 family protein [Hymenobacter sp. BT186]|uniref:SMI1/KNR4 family protein n=1 Tax=Hymenobacter telluris TaxID=2816474 RepID=A0A939EWK9_9BACT|nr:SMI1/KNR4 family protein [Hymenobacter telluris]MBO0358830.1 SMI1/KNR4 family protein [Hymenobacter telluris]MBW3374856.1 SMI1/KNR4 family protein [Hymenobacter norwichensis]